jgi:prepilin-type N-terminal cleavage/methylation domain-containing protein
MLRERRRVHARRSAFTLVELVVVIAALAALATLITPNVARIVDRERLSASAREVLAVATRARDIAVTGESAVELRLDPRTGTFALLPPTDARPQAPRMASPQEPMRGKTEAVPPPLPLGPEIAARVEVEPAATGERTSGDAIRFEPDGTAQRAEITLISRRGDRLVIRILPASGLARVVNPAAEEPR